MASQPTLYRFYRSNLATIVWGKKENKAIAEFVEGQFYTEDPKLAERLIALGYPRISLDATEPPDILFKKGEILTGDVKQLPPGITEEAILNKERLAAAQQKLKEKAEKTSQVKPPAVQETSGDGDLSPAMLTLKHKEQVESPSETKVRKIKRRKGKK